MVVTEKQMLSRVKKGVKLLNESRPGWHKKVKLNTLNMYDDSKCVLGQLYGGVFHTSLKEVGISFVVDPQAAKNAVKADRCLTAALDAGAAYGFSFSCNVLDKLNNDAAIESLFKQLTEVWKAEIRQLRQSLVTAK